MKTIVPCGAAVRVRGRLGHGAGNVREQSDREKRKTACRCRQDELHTEVQAGYLRSASSNERRQEIVRCSEI